MNNHGKVIAEIVLDLGLVVLAFAVIFWGVGYLKAVLAEQRWRAAQVIPDPVDTEIWLVLAEARRITEEAAHDAQ